jgi:DNA helicase II / ATP-dependent DNA helicase PcrA
MDPLLDGLTRAQREAVTHFEGPLLILAGPGSGKTRVVTHRVAWLLRQGIPGRQILALTFTNKAADEMGRRIERLANDPSVWVGTFHRFCARLLRKYAPIVGLQENYTIYDVEDSVRALRQVLDRLKIESLRFTPETLVKTISWAKNHLIAPEEFQPRLGHTLGNVVQAVYPAYQKHLAESNAVDFDDLLLHVATILRESPEIRSNLDERYRFILLDEYQDTNLVQYAIARALSVDHPNLAVTGDPDQSIYGWRGANLNNIMNFERDFDDVHVVRLEQNYRSTQRILQVAEALIAHNKRRKEKGLFTENGPGAPVRLTTYPTQKDEAEGISGRIAADIHSGRRRPRDFAVFYRINALSRSLEFALRDRGVPYQMVNGLEFFQRKEIKDVLAYLHLLDNPRDSVAMQRIINMPPRGIGKTTLDRLAEYATRHGIPLLEAARSVNKISAIAPRIAAKLTQFVALYDRLAANIEGPVEEILGLVLNETGYRKYLSESENEEDQDRLANTEELLTVARDFDERHGDVPGPGVDQQQTVPFETPTTPLEAFLEETCLVNDTDAWETDVDRVTLMTLHASKGLEFPVVFITAVEDGLLPHERSREHPEQLEEERRLLFVGITRAQQELQISTARYRDFRGQRKLTIPSSFLMELPRGEMNLELPEHSGERFHVPDADWHSFEDMPEYAGDDSMPDTDTFKNKTPSAPRKIHLTTAAALANGGRGDSPVDPNSFRQGQWVLHATFGLGQIIALSGSSSTRKATIDFPPPTGRKKIPLSEDALRPVGA